MSRLFITGYSHLKVSLDKQLDIPYSKSQIKGKAIIIVLPKSGKDDEKEEYAHPLHQRGRPIG